MGYRWFNEETASDTGCLGLKGPVTVEPIGANLICMRMKLIRKLLLIWMIAWLPAAGVLAAVMPLSGLMMSMTTASASNATSTDDMEMSFMPCHGKPMPAKMAPGQGCSHCVLCHLAGALVMPEMPVVATLAPTHIFTATPLAIPPSFIPELTSPPPRLSLA